MRTDLCADCGRPLAEHGDSTEPCPSGDPQKNPDLGNRAAANAKLIALAEHRKKHGRTCDDPKCPGWIISDSGERGLEVERCDDCWRPFPEGKKLYDEEAAALPEAQRALRAELKRNPGKTARGAFYNPAGGVAPPSYDEQHGWMGGDSKTLYAFTDKRTGKVTVRPGGGRGKPGLHHIGPEASVRVATRAEAEAHWQDPLHPGWVVADRENPVTYAGPVRSTELFELRDGQYVRSTATTASASGPALFRRTGSGRFQRVNPRR